MKGFLEGAKRGAWLIAACVAVLLLEIGLGLWSTHLRHRAPPPPKTAAMAPAPLPAPPAAPAQTPVPAPAPAAEEQGPLPPNPPATETSPQTVIEENPAAAAPAAPAPAVAPPGEPAWEKYALAAPPSGGKPMIAVIIDDMGVDHRRSERILKLPGPLTISFMTYAEKLPEMTAEARRRGDELMMHVPMQPMAAGVDPGPNALLTSLPPEEIRRRLQWDLARFSGYVGINNHMGSRFTADAPGMALVMEALRRRGLLFIDSLTTPHSVGLALARHYGVPTTGRNVFLDNAGDLQSVDLQLQRPEAVARRLGTAIAIGHPRDGTIAALSAWLPTLRRKGFVLVPVTAVVRARLAEGKARNGHS